MSPAPSEPVHDASPLPQPTGRHTVGRLATEWIDPSRRDIYVPDPATPRHLVLWIWYPCQADANAPRAEHLPGAWAAVSQYLGVDARPQATHAIRDAPLTDDTDAYPVLVLSPSGFSPLMMAAIAEELASHGYVVVGVNHTYESTVTAFADGRVVPMDPAALGGALGPQTGSYEEAFAKRAAVCEYKAADLSSVADHLERLPAFATGLATGRLDLDRMGAFGHSFGGNASLEWCRSDGRCRAAVNLDGAVWTTVGNVGLPRPALQVLAGHPEFAMSGEEAVHAGITADAEWYEAEKALAFEGWRNVHRLARPGHTAQIAGSTHLSFMDLPFLPFTENSAASGMLGATTIEPARMWRITSDLLLAFFDRYLPRGAVTAGGGLLDGPDPAYPEVTVGPP